MANRKLRFRSNGKSRCSVVLRSIAFWPIVVTLGCAHHTVSIETARNAYYQGDLVEAADQLRNVIEHDRSNRDAAMLDLAVVELAGGDPRSAQSRLRQLRDQFDALPTFASLNEAAAMVSDDTMRLYRPAGYEQVMIRTMLAFCSLADDQIDAESYTLQAMTKQRELAFDASRRGVVGVPDAYQPIAIAPYLRGVLREATYHDYDDAASAYRLASTIRPQFQAARVDLERVSGGIHSQPGHGALYVIALVGRGPILRETDAPTTSAALTIASSMIRANRQQAEDRRDHRDDVVLPNIASVKIPKVEVPSSNVTTVGVRRADQWIGTTEPLTDIVELAINQENAELPWTIARSVVRRATKETLVATLSDQLGLEGTAQSLFHFAAASTWSGSEHADLRCWSLLPRQIQVLRAELPVGDHTIEVQPMNDVQLSQRGNPTFQQPSIARVSIVDGRNTYLIALAPGPAVYLIPGGNPSGATERVAVRATNGSAPSTR